LSSKNGPVSEVQVIQPKRFTMSRALAPLVIFTDLREVTTQK